MVSNFERILKVSAWLSSPNLWGFPKSSKVPGSLSTLKHAKVISDN